MAVDEEFYSFSGIVWSTSSESEHQVEDTDGVTNGEDEDDEGEWQQKWCHNVTERLPRIRSIDFCSFIEFFRNALEGSQPIDEGVSHPFPYPDEAGSDEDGAAVTQKWDTGKVYAPKLGEDDTDWSEGRVQDQDEDNTDDGTGGQNRKEEHGAEECLRLTTLPVEGKGEQKGEDETDWDNKKHELEGDPEGIDEQFVLEEVLVVGEADKPHPAAETSHVGEGKVDGLEKRPKRIHAVADDCRKQE